MSSHEERSPRPEHSEQQYRSHLSAGGGSGTEDISSYQNDGNNNNNESSDYNDRIRDSSRLRELDDFVIDNEPPQLSTPDIWNSSLIDQMDTDYSLDRENHDAERQRTLSSTGDHHSENGATNDNSEQTRTELFMCHGCYNEFRAVPSTEFAVLCPRCNSDFCEIIDNSDDDPRFFASDNMEEEDEGEAEDDEHDYIFNNFSNRYSSETAGSARDDEARERERRHNANVMGMIQLLSSIMGNRQGGVQNFDFDFDSSRRNSASGQSPAGFFSSNNSGQPGSATSEMAGERRSNAPNHIYFNINGGSGGFTMSYGNNGDILSSPNTHNSNIGDDYGESHDLNTTPRQSTFGSANIGNNSAGSNNNSPISSSNNNNTNNASNSGNNGSQPPGFQPSPIEQLSTFLQQTFAGFGDAQVISLGNTTPDGTDHNGTETRNPRTEAMSQFFGRIFNVPGNPSDYVWSQNDLDQIITQLMEQTQANHAPAPASQNDILALPTKFLSSELLERSSECAICKDKYETTDQVTILPCEHFFHPACIKHWLGISDSCPICRHPISSKTVVDDDTLSVNNQNSFDMNANVMNDRSRSPEAEPLD
ncbi:hypothetical protein V1511DRAFT_519368 [Dipodascopsis uninucleata]